MLTFVPLRSKEAVKVVDSLYQGYVCLFGAPMQIHTNNGQEFQNKIWSSLFKRMRVLETKHLHTILALTKWRGSTGV